MTDNLCGGSTPLKALAEQGARDRSLQQDRTHHAAAGPLTFRSNQSSSSRDASYSYSTYLGGHDPYVRTPSSTEYGALPLPAHLTSFETGSRHVVHAAAPDAAPYVPQVANWAQDFDQFRHETASPAQGPLVPCTSIQHSHSYQPHGQPFPFMPSNQAMIAPQAPISMVGRWPTTTFSDQHAQIREGRDIEFDTAMTHWMTSNGDTGVEEQVDAVMDELARELDDVQRAEVAKPALSRMKSVNNQAASLADTSDLGTLATATVDRSVSSIPDITSLQLTDHAGARGLSGEVCHNGKGVEKTDTTGVKSEVSEAARQLLQTVQHEQGEKWKQSQFLLLMRDFRDGQKDIVDNEIRQANT